jgi:hypothetical protein
MVNGTVAPALAAGAACWAQATDALPKILADKIASFKDFIVVMVKLPRQ